MQTKTVMATMFNSCEPKVGTKPIPLNTSVQCEVFMGATGYKMVRCTVGDKKVGCFAVKGSIGVTMLPNTIHFNQELVERMPQSFSGKIVGIGTINIGHERHAYQVEVEIPADIDVSFAGKTPDAVSIKKNSDIRQPVGKHLHYMSSTEIAKFLQDNC